MGFLDKLRLNGIYPTGDGSRGDAMPVGMPDFSLGNINMSTVDQLGERARAFGLNNHPDIMHGTAYTPPSNNGTNRLNSIGPVQPGTTNSMPQNVVWGDDSYKSGNISPLNKIKLDQGQQKIDMAGQKLEAGNTLNSRKADISQERADAYDFKQRHPNMIMKAPKGGNIVAIDPITGKTMDTGISTGTLTDRDRLDIESKNNIKAIDERGDKANELQDKKDSSDLAEIAAKTAGGIKRDAAKGASKTGMIPTQQKVDVANKANKLRNSNPELANFIHFNSDGTFTIDAPATPGFFGHSGPTKEQFDQINQSIYGSTTGPATTNPTPTPDKKKDPAGIRPDDANDFESDDEGDE